MIQPISSVVFVGDGEHFWSLLTDLLSPQLFCFMGGGGGYSLLQGEGSGNHLTNLTNLSSIMKQLQIQILSLAGLIPPSPIPNWSDSLSVQDIQLRLSIN